MARSRQAGRRGHAVVNGREGRCISTVGPGDVVALQARAGTDAASRRPASLRMPSGGWGGGETAATAAEAEVMSAIAPHPAPTCPGPAPGAQGAPGKGGLGVSEQAGWRE